MIGDQKVPLLIKLRFEIINFFINDTIYIQHKTALKSLDIGCLPFDRKIRLGCRKHSGKRFISLPPKCHIRYGLNPKKGRICVAWVWNREGTEKLVNGKQHSFLVVPTGMKGLPQNVLLNFRLEFPKSYLTRIYLPSGISEIFFWMVSTHRIITALLKLLSLTMHFLYEITKCHSWWSFIIRRIIQYIERWFCLDVELISYYTERCWKEVRKNNL